MRTLWSWNPYQWARAIRYFNVWAVVTRQHKAAQLIREGKYVDYARDVATFWFHGNDAPGMDAVKYSPPLAVEYDPTTHDKHIVVALFKNIQDDR